MHKGQTCQHFCQGLRNRSRQCNRARRAQLTKNITMHRNARLHRRVHNRDALRMHAQWGYGMIYVQGQKRPLPEGGFPSGNLITQLGNFGHMRGLTG